MNGPSPALPDTRRQPPWPTVRSAVSRQVWRAALKVAHTCLDPRSRERFAEAGRPLAPEPLPYETDDGWRCFLHHCAPLPEATGEPVILAPGPGLNRKGLDHGGGNSLVALLRSAGYAVYVLEHRAHRSAVRQHRQAPPATHLDLLATQEVPAAIQAVLEHSGFDRAGWVGHGLGGILLYMHLATEPYAPLFALVSLAAPVTFRRSVSRATQAARAVRLLPPHLQVPTRAAASLLAPWASGNRLADRPHWSRHVPGPRVRSLLTEASEDLTTGLLAHVMRWFEQGSLCDHTDRIDYLEALGGITLPVQTVAAPEDPLCTPEQAHAVLPRCAGPVEAFTVPGAAGHLDLVGGEGPGVEEMGRRVLAWLQRWRHRAG